jgi:hypothetical protein
MRLGTRIANLLVALEEHRCRGGDAVTSRALSERRCRGRCSVYFKRDFAYDFPQPQRHARVRDIGLRIHEFHSVDTTNQYNQLYASENCRY